MSKRMSRFCVLNNRKSRRKNKLLDERNGESDRRGDRSSTFIVKKVRISVYLQVHLDSFQTRVVSLEVWTLQIMVWSIITWKTSTMVPTVLCDTGPHLWHTCPTRQIHVRLPELMSHTKRQGIWTTTKFAGLFKSGSRNLNKINFHCILNEWDREPKSFFEKTQSAVSKH
jgi:hypothetical protein